MNEPNPFEGAVVPHEHVTLDEDVFHRYQDIAEYARRLVAGETTLGVVGLGYYVQRLDEALARSHLRNEMDPEHHLKPTTT